MLLFQFQTSANKDVMHQYCQTRFDQRRAAEICEEYCHADLWPPVFEHRYFLTLPFKFYANETVNKTYENPFQHLMPQNVT